LYKYSLILLTFYVTDSTAQNLASLGNYAGLSTINNNPSLAVFSKLQYDINLLRIDVSAFSNNFYLDRSNDYTLSQKPTTRTLLFADAEIAGPGFLWVSRKRSIAFKTALKTTACSNGLNEQTANMLYHEMKGGGSDSVTLGLKDGKQLNAISYGELAISFAWITRNNGTRMISFGYTGKVLLGFMATSLMSKNTTPHDGPDGTTYTTADIQYAYAFPNPDRDRSMFSMRGIGVGTDLGFTYMRRRFAKPRYSGCPSVIKRHIPANDYSWKFSLALLDVGGIMFQREAKKITLTNINTTLDTLSMKQLKNNYKFDSLLTQRAAGNTQEGSFYVGLPTSLVFQIDRYIGWRFFFAHVYLQQRVITDKGIRMFKVNQLTLCPRYETPYWEVGLKAGVIEYAYPILGAMVRVGSLNVGIDYITDSSLNAVYGAQIHVGLGIQRVKGRRMPRMRF
jgi:hypothetical protein